MPMWWVSLGLAGLLTQGGCLGLGSTEVAKLQYDIQIRDAKTGNPIADAEVLLWWSREFARSRTDEEGRVRLRLEDRQTVHAIGAIGNIFSPGGYSYAPFHLEAKGVIIAPGHVPTLFRRPAHEFARDGDWSIRAEAIPLERPAPAEDASRIILQALRTLEAAVHLYAPYPGGRPVLHWSADVAGLHRLHDGAIVGRDLAAADAAPLPEHDLNGPEEARPYFGYHFRMISTNRGGLRLQPLAREGPTRFCMWWGGVCASPSNGGPTYILDLEGVIYRKDTGGEPVLRFPASPLDEGWVPLVGR